MLQGGLLAITVCNSKLNNGYTLYPALLIL